jgi:hypothetical protein
MIGCFRRCLTRSAGSTGLAAVVWLAIAADAAWAQRATLDLQGLVTDEQGAVLPGATINVRNLETGLTRTAVSDEGGRYVIPELPAGTRYEIKVDLAGFTTALLPNQTFSAGVRVTLIFPLKLSAVRETVTVSARAPMVDTTAAKVGNTITQQALETLPVKEHNYFRLVVMNSSIYNQPGTSIAQSNAGDVWTTGTYVDGTNNFSRQLTLQAGPQQGSGGFAFETIKELQTITNQYSAEFGGNSGAVISAITKSGTNELKGSAFVGIRPGRLDAKPPFATTTAPFSQQQFGATLGGPLAKNRVFFFGNYQQRRERSNVVVTSPKAPGVVVPTPADEYLGHGRIDAQITSANHLAARYNFDHLFKLNESGGLNLPGTGFQWDNNVDIAHVTHSAVVSDKQLNEVRVQFIHYWDLRSQISAGPQINRAGYAVEGNFSSATQGFGIPEDTYDLSDTFSLWRGTHSVKIGGAYNHNRSREHFVPNENGVYRFSGPPSVAPAPFLFQQGLALSPEVGTTNPAVHMLSGYVQDSWRAARSLSLNLGVRYDLELIRDAPGYDAPADNDNVDPRIGLAWDVKGNQRWVLRGGVGRFTQQQLPFTFVRGGLNGPNGVVALSLSPSDPNFPVFPNSLPAFPLGAILPARNVELMATDLENEFTWQNTAGLQRQFGEGTTFTVDYSHVWGQRQGFLDTNAPTANVPGSVRTIAQADATRPRLPRPNGFREILVLGNQGRLWYNGVRVALEHRTGRLTFLTNYTWAKSENMLNHFTPPEDSTAFALDKGPANTDVRHNFVTSATWSGSATNPILKDWNVSAIVQARSGLPYNITYGDDRNGTGQSDARPGRRNSGRQDGYENVDFSLTRVVPVSGRTHLEVRAMAFNLMNSKNYTGFVGQLSSPRSGQPTSGTPGRQFQFEVTVKY